MRAAPSEGRGALRTLSHERRIAAVVTRSANGSAITLAMVERSSRISTSAWNGFSISGTFRHNLGSAA